MIRLISGGTPRASISRQPELAYQRKSVMEVVRRWLRRACQAAIETTGWPSPSHP